MSLGPKPGTIAAPVLIPSLREEMEGAEVVPEGGTAAITSALPRPTEGGTAAITSALALGAPRARLTAAHSEAEDLKVLGQLNIPLEASIWQK
jgi:hypothetical protein